MAMPPRNTETIPVVFCRLAGATIAVFPTIPADPLGYDCEGTAPLDPERTPRSGVPIDLAATLKAAEAAEPDPALVELLSNHYGWTLAPFTAPLDAHHCARRKAAARWRKAELEGPNE